MSPELVWGLMVRGLGLVYALAFASLAVQIVPLAGREGISPVSALHGAMRRDFGVLTRWLRFPSLLWLHDGDGMLRGLTWIGVAAGLSVVVGGPHTSVALLLCWGIYLSLDRAVGLVYPWDSLLLEAGLWAAALPTALLAPQLGLERAPDPALTWLFRLLLFRVMFGFGKQKFLGSKSEDAGFLHGFLIRQPLPTPLGWWAHNLPMPVLVAGLGVMFVVEMVLPFGAFVPGWPSMVFFAATVALMVAIELTGNFGFFNLLTIVLAVCLLDQSTPLDLDLASYFGTLDGAGSRDPWTVLLHGLVAFHTIGVLVVLPLNTWASFTWTQWTFWRRVRPRPLAWFRLPFRALQPFRWLHAYGVFPPRAAPAIRMSPQLEVTWDEREWLEVGFHHWPGHEKAVPPVVAPHHPRVDQAVVYEAVGFEETGPLRGLTGRWDPYGHARISGAGDLILAILRGKACASRLLRLPPAPGGTPDSPPKAARVRLYMLEPATPAQRRVDGRWWHRRPMPDHLPELRLGDPYLDPRPPVPELWSVEDLWWMECSRMGPMLRAMARGEPTQDWVLHGAPDLTHDDLVRFWTEFVPWLASLDRHDGSSLSSHVSTMRDRWAPETLARLERVCRRHVLCFVARWAPELERGGLGPILRRRADPMGFHNHAHMERVAQHILMGGQAGFERAMAEPSFVVSQMKTMTAMSTYSAVFLDALWSPERLHHHVLKMHQLAAQLDVGGRPTPRESRLRTWGGEVMRRLWGSFERIDLLRELDASQLEEGAQKSPPWPRFDQEGLRFRRRE